MFGNPQPYIFFPRSPGAFFFFYWFSIFAFELLFKKPKFSPPTCFGFFPEWLFLDLFWGLVFSPGENLKLRCWKFLTSKTILKTYHLVFNPESPQKNLFDSLSLCYLLFILFFKFSKKFFPLPPFCFSVSLISFWPLFFLKRKKLFFDIFGHFFDFKVLFTPRSWVFRWRGGPF